MSVARKVSLQKLPKSESTQQPNVSETGQHIRRPANAFFCFRSAFYKEHKSAAPTAATRLNQRNLSRSAAEVWRTMNQAQREPFKRMADKKFAEQAKKYPGYKYGGQGKTKKGTEVRSTHKAARKSSKAMAYRKSPPPPPESTSIATSASASPTPTPEPVEEAKPATPTPVSEPFVDVKPIIQAKVKPAAAEIHASPVRPASYDRVPAQFKAHILPSVIAALTLARCTPSPAPASYPSTAAYELPALPPHRSVSPGLPYLPSPDREIEWAATFEMQMHEMELELELGFSAPVAMEDFGFYHPAWDALSGRSGVFEPLDENHEWDFSLMHMGN
ncbi:hypothetical protein FB45DRAFT_1143145 [Roridomyces roridus]|uniref:HMG box domain-containing protein n=1 Tax=Roridomyces roridus TaxID=1738132 RepID=A0AAD7BZW7_9AGAR|nr:hypothetical protein FB45DRAFT_1143145 [Roridomyces roridus]